MKKISKIASLLLVGSAAFIVGCGHSSSSSTTIPSTVTGTVSDGYVMGATVCVDLNKNGKCDSSDYNVSTDENGKFSIPANYKNYPIIVLPGGIDKATGNIVVGMRLKPNGSSNPHVTPITTLIAAAQENGENNLTKIAQALGMSEDNLYKDPVATAGENNASKAVLKLNFLTGLTMQNGVEQVSYADLGKNLVNDTNLTKSLKSAADSVKIDVNTTVAEKGVQKINDLNTSNPTALTYAEQTVQVVALAAKKDPKIVDQNITKLQKVVEIVHQYLQKDKNASLLGDANISQIVVNTVNNVVVKNSNISKIVQDTNQVITYAKIAATAVVKAKEDNKTVDTSTLIQHIVENNITNPVDINLTQFVPVQFENHNVTIAGKTYPVKVVNGVGTFYATIYTNNDSTWQDFQTVSFSGVKEKSLEGKNGPYDANITMLIQDDKSDKVFKVTIQNAKIDINTSDTKSPIKLILNSFPNHPHDFTEVKVYQYGLSALDDTIPSGVNKTATLNSDLTKSDFSVSLSTLINHLDKNQYKISEALKELDTYLRKSRSYTVTTTITTSLPLEAKSLIGYVTVINPSYDIQEAEDYLNKNLSEIFSPETNLSNIKLPTEYNGVTIEWNSNDYVTIAKDGTIKLNINNLKDIPTDTSIELKANLTENNVTESYFYPIDLGVLANKLGVNLGELVQQTSKNINTPSNTGSSTTANIPSNTGSSTTANIPSNTGSSTTANIPSNTGSSTTANIPGQ